MLSNVKYWRSTRKQIPRSYLERWNKQRTENSHSCIIGTFYLPVFYIFIAYSSICLFIFLFSYQIFIMSSNKQIYISMDVFQRLIMIQSKYMALKLKTRKYQSNESKFKIKYLNFLKNRKYFFMKLERYLDQTF